MTNLAVKKLTVGSTNSFLFWHQCGNQNAFESDENNVGYPLKNSVMWQHCNTCIRRKMINNGSKTAKNRNPKFADSV